MNLQDFRGSGNVAGHIKYKGFEANIAYSAPGSGHYFILTNVAGHVSYLIQFLEKWEDTYSFCVDTHRELIREELEKRKYTTDEKGRLRIGIKMELEADLFTDRFERQVRDLRKPRPDVKRTGRPKKAREAAE